MKFDTHLHTLPFSQDAGQQLNDLTSALSKLHIGGIITEHLDFDYPLDPKIVLFNPEDYFDRYGPFRSDKLLLGVELGLQQSCRDKNQEVAKKFPWDYVLISLHVLYGADLFSKKYYENRPQTEVYQNYLLSLIEETKGIDDFDSLAHIDYICRYNQYEKPNLSYHSFPDHWDQLFTILAQKEKALELNTRRLEIPGSKESLYELLQRFRELGGRHITIGSDAHMPHSVGKNLAIAYEMVEKANLQPVYFKERKCFKI